MPTPRDAAPAPENFKPAQEDQQKPLYSDELMRSHKSLTETKCALIHDLELVDSQETRKPLAKGEAGQTTVETIKIGDTNRSYRLHVPKNYDPERPTALMLVYHGMSNPKKATLGDGGHGAVGIENVTGLSEKSDDRNFVVAYLQGNERKDNSWNNGQWAFSNNDDIGFTKGVIKELSRDLNIDKSKVFAVGFSQGESFVHHLGNDPSMRGQFRAIGVVSGWLPETEKLHCDKKDPHADDISMISIKCADDKTVPYGGRFDWPVPIVGDILRAQAGMHSEPEEFNWYLKRDDIKGGIEQTEIYDATDWKLGQEPPLMATEKTAANSHGDTITSVKVEGLKHVWPGGAGGESRYNATNRILEFFKLHELPG